MTPSVKIGVAFALNTELLGMPRQTSFASGLSAVNSIITEVLPIPLAYILFPSSIGRAIDISYFGSIGTLQYFSPDAGFKPATASG